MPAQVQLLLGTRRGLFAGSSDTRRKRWSFRGPLICGEPVYSAVADPRDGRTFYAAVNSMHWGPSVHVSRDRGRTWIPARRQPRFAKDSGRTVKAIWHIQPGGTDEPKTVYAGIDPGALFRSEDGGETWDEIPSLSRHETHPRWQPGGGGLCLHSILVDPTDSKHLIVAISAVGVFESFDRGDTWKLANEGLASVFTPDAKGGPEC